MKEEGQVKIGLGMVVCILLIFALTIACGGLYYFGFVDKKETTVATSSTLNSEVEKKDGVEEKAETTSETEEKKVGKIDESKEWVYDIKNSNDNNLPYINIDSESIKQINKDISEIYKDVKEEHGDFGISYEYFINDNILSLLIHRGYTNDYVEYKTYNIDMTTGKPVSNLELLYSKNILENEYIEKVKNAYEADTSEYLKNHKSEGVFDELFLGELKDQSCSINTPMYLDEEGKINVVAKVCSFAGAAYYYHLLKVE